MPEQEPPDPDADPSEVARDDELVEDLRAGQVPDGDALAPALAAWRDEVQRPVSLSGWLADPSTPSGWRWLPDLSVVEDTAALPVVPAGQVRYAGSVDYARPPRPYRYVYTDPVTDDGWPRITEQPEGDPPDTFPPGWGHIPTERDQAAIDAGNA